MVDPAHPSSALTGVCKFTNLTLPERLPRDPFGTVVEWLELAAKEKVQPNPNAMSLATVGMDGQPSCRIVLCRRIDPDRGYLVFYTNYLSHKGRDIAANPKAAVCFHWDDLDRQVRIEGIVSPSPAKESDAYFNGRPLLSRVAAWASAQSRPLDSRELLIKKEAQARAKFGVPPDGAEPTPDPQPVPHVPRPDYWGGYRLWATRVELWLGHTNRLHDRAVWERALAPDLVDGVPGFSGGSWRATRLQP